MTQPSPDARAVVRALDALTTQVRRLADQPPTPVVRVTNDDPTTGDDAFRTLMDVPTPAPITVHLPGQPPLVGTWHGGGCGRPRESSELVWEPTITFSDRRPPMDRVHILGIDPSTPDGVTTTPVVVAHGDPDLNPAAREALDALADVAVQQFGEQAPADDDQKLRWARRESLLVLLTRLQRGRHLTEDEARTLRHHVETEMREADTARTEATRLGLMVDEYGKGASTLSEKLRKAQRAADLLADSHRRAEQLEELLSVAHETSNRSEAERARAVQRAEEIEHDRDRLTAELEDAEQRAEAFRTERDQAQAALERVCALAPMLDGLENLLATSSRDWGEYRVDAWLWAVLCGWDCEDNHEHTEQCGDAMSEQQQRHGWSDEAVAKARRYRAAVRAVAALDGTEQPTTED